MSAPARLTVRSLHGGLTVVIECRGRVVLTASRRTRSGAYQPILHPESGPAMRSTPTRTQRGLRNLAHAFVANEDAPRR